MGYDTDEAGPEWREIALRGITTVASNGEFLHIRSGDNWITLTAGEWVLVKSAAEQVIHRATILRMEGK